MSLGFSSSSSSSSKRFPLTVIVSMGPMPADGHFADKLCLQKLQSKMKCDPESYETDLELIYQQFKSSLEIFEQQAALSFMSVSGIPADSSIAKGFGEQALFLAHLTQFYPKHLSLFPKQLTHLLRTTASSLPSSLRFQLTQALILLVNRKIVAIGETLTLFMKLQILGDKSLKKLAFSHVVCFIQRMNKRHKNEDKNKPLQNTLFRMLQSEEESIAKRSLVTLCDLHRRKVWSDERTVNAICMACFHPSSRVMIAALSFLLHYDKIQDDDDSDASSGEDEGHSQLPQVVLSKEDVYKSYHKGTTTSKKKKKAKLQRVIRSMKRRQRLSSEKSDPTYYSPLAKLQDPQGFADKLFSRLQRSQEEEDRMMMLSVIARTIGLHQLILLRFYPFLQKYVLPNREDIIKILAAAVQACHDMVPPDAVQPLFKHIVDQFVHDRSRTEVITVGLNVVREICLRMPLLMNEDLLQDLVLYKKSHEKVVSSAARSLITLFREICPSLLVKKDRGRSTDLEARPKEYGEVNVAIGVPGAELLQPDEAIVDEDSDLEEDCVSSFKEVEEEDDTEDDISGDADLMAYCGSEDGAIDEDGTETETETETQDEDEDMITVGEEVSDADHSKYEEESCRLIEFDDGNENSNGARKRKYTDFDQQLETGKSSLRALKKLTAVKLEHSKTNDRIYSNEDFQRIKELQAKKKAQCALLQHGLLKCSNSKSATIKVPSLDQLSIKPVNPAKLEANIRTKMTKEERVESMQAGREEREGYKSRAATKKKKHGGLSNRQKERKKFMPIAAMRGKIARSKEKKKREQMRSGKQFRGKAWK